MFVLSYNKHDLVPNPCTDFVIFSISMVTHAMVDFLCYSGFFNALKIGNFQRKGLKYHFSKNFSINFLVLSQLAN